MSSLNFAAGCCTVVTSALRPEEGRGVPVGVGVEGGVPEAEGVMEGVGVTESEGSGEGVGGALGSGGVLGALLCEGCEEVCCCAEGIGEEVDAKESCGGKEGGLLTEALALLRAVAEALLVAAEEALRPLLAVAVAQREFGGVRLVVALTLVREVSEAQGLAVGVRRGEGEAEGEGVAVGLLRGVGEAEAERSEEREAKDETEGREDEEGENEGSAEAEGKKAVGEAPRLSEAMDEPLGAAVSVGVGDAEAVAASAGEGVTMGVGGRVGRGTVVALGTPGVEDGGGVGRCSAEAEGEAEPVPPPSPPFPAEADGGVLGEGKAPLGEPRADNVGVGGGDAEPVERGVRVDVPQGATTVAEGVGCAAAEGWAGAEGAEEIVGVIKGEAVCVARLGVGVGSAVRDTESIAPAVGVAATVAASEVEGAAVAEAATGESVKIEVAEKLPRAAVAVPAAKEPPLGVPTTLLVPQTVAAGLSLPLPAREKVGAEDALLSAVAASEELATSEAREEGVAAPPGLSEAAELRLARRPPAGLCVCSGDGLGVGVLPIPGVTVAAPGVPVGAAPLGEAVADAAACKPPLDEGEGEGGCVALPADGETLPAKPLLMDAHGLALNCALGDGEVESVAARGSEGEGVAVGAPVPVGGCEGEGTPELLCAPPEALAAAPVADAKIEGEGTEEPVAAETGLLLPPSPPLTEGEPVAERERKGLSEAEEEGDAPTVKVASAEARDENDAASAVAVPPPEPDAAMLPVGVELAVGVGGALSVAPRKLGVPTPPPPLLRVAASAEALAPSAMDALQLELALFAGEPLGGPLLPLRNAVPLRLREPLPLPLRSVDTEALWQALLVKRAVEVCCALDCVWRDERLPLPLLLPGVDGEAQ